jgi:hypothetical protein
LRSSVPDGPVLPGWQRVGRLPDEREFIIGGKHGLRFYTPRRPRVRRDVVAEWLASERTPREMEMSVVAGNQQDWNAQPGVPGGRLESEAAVREGVAAAMSALSASQAQAKTFFTSYGDSVSAGHPATNAAPVAADRG